MNNENLIPKRGESGNLRLDAIELLLDQGESTEAVRLAGLLLDSYRSITGKTIQQEIAETIREAKSREHPEVYADEWVKMLRDIEHHVARLEQIIRQYGEK